MSLIVGVGGDCGEDIAVLIAEIFQKMGKSVVIRDRSLRKRIIRNIVKLRDDRGFYWYNDIPVCEMEPDELLEFDVTIVFFESGVSETDLCNCERVLIVSDGTFNHLCDTVVIPDIGGPKDLLLREIPLFDVDYEEEIEKSGMNVENVYITNLNSDDIRIRKKFGDLKNITLRYYSKEIQSALLSFIYSIDALSNDKKSEFYIKKNRMEKRKWGVL